MPSNFWWVFVAWGVCAVGLGGYTLWMLARLRAKRRELDRPTS